MERRLRFPGQSFGQCIQRRCDWQVSPLSGGWEKLLHQLLWVWVSDLGWHVTGVRNRPLVCSAKIMGGKGRGSVLTYLYFNDHHQPVSHWTPSRKTRYYFVARGQVSTRQNVTCLQESTVSFHQRETGYNFSPHSSRTNPVLQSHANMFSRSKL